MLARANCCAVSLIRLLVDERRQRRETTLIQKLNAMEEGLLLRHVS